MHNVLDDLDAQYKKDEGERALSITLSDENEGSVVLGYCRQHPAATIYEQVAHLYRAMRSLRSLPRFHARVAEAFALIVSRRRAVNGTLVVVTHGLVCRALVERHALAPEGISVPATFDNTSVTGLHENAPHAVALINCTQHLVTSLGISGAPA